jgi:hypothetical protein
MLASGTESTYPKDIRDHRLTFVYMGYYKAIENKSTGGHLQLSKESRNFLSGLPSRIPPDMSGGDRSIHMAPYTEDKVPSMAYRIRDGYSTVDRLVDISDCMNGRRNREGHTGVDI